MVPLFPILLFFLTQKLSLFNMLRVPLIRDGERDGDGGRFVVWGVTIVLVRMLVLYLLPLYIGQLTGLR